jgi:hypothetical protein
LPLTFKAYEGVSDEFFEFISAMQLQTFGCETASGYFVAIDFGNDFRGFDFDSLHILRLSERGATDYKKKNDGYE